MRCYGVDAMIFYLDIVVLVVVIGFGVDIVFGMGLVVVELFWFVVDFVCFCLFEFELDMLYVFETCCIFVRELVGIVLFIGFVGVLFMVVSYFIEGRFSCIYMYIKVFMYGDEVLWYCFMERLVVMVVILLRS